MTDEKKITDPEEFSEEELEQVTGGGLECKCMLGGGGTGDGKFTVDGVEYDERTCACVGGGGGEFYRNGEKYCRCVCVAAGGGNTAEVCQGNGENEL